MNTATKLKSIRYERRKKHIRKKITGSPERYRLTVTRSLSNISAQIIDDVAMHTLVSASSQEKQIKDALASGKKTKTEISVLVGTLLAERAVAKNIQKVAFDRNGYLYHGRVKALADSARTAGLEF
jgi:large subunit ribosomal protein L18